MRLRGIAGGAALILGIAFWAAADPDTAPYKIAKSIPLGPGERWDYVTFDPKSDRAFVAHGDHVTVVDLAKGAIVGDIGPFPGGTHGIGVPGATGHGYTDDGKAGIVGVFDRTTLKVLARIPAAPDADGIVFDPASRHMLIVDGDSGTITVIDPATDASVATIAVGAPLEAGVVDGKGRFYVDGAEQHDIVAIDTRTNAVLAHWPMPGCERPHGIAVDPETRRVFASCVNKVLVVMDADTGTVVTTLPIGAGSDGAVFDPVRKLIVSANGEGTLSVIREQDKQTFVPVATVPTVRSARTIAIDPGTGRLFVPAADIAAIDPPATPGGRPHVTFVPGSLRLLVLEPAR